VIKQLCDKIYEIFISQTKDCEHELMKKIHELGAYFYTNTIDVSMIESLIDLEQKIVTVKGSHKKYLEEQILQSLVRESHVISINKEECDQELVNKSDIDEIVLILVEFAKSLFEYNIPRDSFNNQRKAFGLEILKHLSDGYEIPEAFELCLMALKSKKKQLIFAAIDFYEHYVCADDIELSQEVIEILDKIITQTKDRSVAVSALNFQVEAGLISEFEALSRIDEWKEKNDVW